jgi:CubicO group peptidase (beta-lactamase class C family)
MTIFTVLRIQEDKLVNINDKLSNYLQSDQNNDYSKITIFDIMNHKSGIKFVGDKAYKIPLSKFENSTQASNFFMDEKLFTLPYGSESYSIISYVLLGRVMEQITKKTYMDLYNQYIFNQFDLKNTFVGNTNIKLYHNNKDLHEQQIFERYFAGPTGGLSSTIADLLKFSQMPKYLSKESLEILKKMYVFKEKKNKFLLEASGDISGGKSSLIYTYDNNFNILDADIKMKTN